MIGSGRRKAGAYCSSPSPRSHALRPCGDPRLQRAAAPHGGYSFAAGRALLVLPMGKRVRFAGSRLQRRSGRFPPSVRLYSPEALCGLTEGFLTVIKKMARPQRSSRWRRWQVRYLASPFETPPGVSAAMRSTTTGRSSNGADRLDPVTGKLFGQQDFATGVTGLPSPGPRSAVIG
jgi:hypothetical protein